MEQEILGIIERHLKKATEDLNECKRGANWGRVQELTAVLADIGALYFSRDEQKEATA